MKEMNEQLGQLALDYKAKEDSMYEEIAPTALKMFDKGAVNNLVDAYNTVSKLFGLAGDYPAFSSDLKSLPADFVKGLSMIKKSVDDAVIMDAVDESLSFSLAGINTSNGLRMLATQLIGLSRDRGFKQFLLEQPVEEPVESTEEEPAPTAQMAPAPKSSKMSLGDLLGKL